MKLLHHVAMKNETHKNLALRLLTIAILLASFTSMIADADVDKIIAQLGLFNEKCYQQKVYLHTDKSVYNIHENIWFKAYVVNAIDHTPDTISTNLYVDLVSPQNRGFNRLVLKLDKGIGYGDIALDIDSLPEGNYQLRAYTNWMLNFDNGYIFTKTIRIKNPGYQQYLERSKYLENKRLNKRLKKDIHDVTIEFFPEGGSLLYGVINRVAFKAMDGTGLGKDFKGFVVNGKGKEIIKVCTLHKGMGMFSFTPVEGEKYFIVTNSFGGKLKVQLPDPSKRGMGMSIDNISDDKNIIINLYTNEKASYDEIANQVILIGQTRNKVFFAEKIPLPMEGKRLIISKSLFPSGITQFTLFNNILEPVAERLVFKYPVKSESNNITCTKIESDKENYAKYLLQFENRKPDNYYNISLAVLSNDSTSLLDRTNIMTHLLLTSDISGNIENPSWYFNKNENEEEALDLVMMVNGWRRFVWSEILKNDFPEIKHPVEKGITISGDITRYHFDIPVNGGDVTLYILNEYNDFFTYKTEDKGRFFFDGLEYYDTMDVKIEGRTSFGRKNVLINVDETELPQIVRYDRQKLLASQDKKSMKVPNYPKVKEKQYNVNSIHGPADYVIEMDKINTDGYSNLFQVLDGRVPGLEVTGNDIVIRGAKSLNSSSSPLVIFDGVPTDVSILGATNPSDVYLIEILKGPNTAIYGFRGGNGVIAVYTRRGEFMVRGEITFQMMGYHKAREFYRPELNIIEGNISRNIKSSTILWKPDILLDDNGEAFFYIPQKDMENSMYINLEGISSDGEIIVDDTTIKD